jgi:hypothetical protein
MSGSRPSDGSMSGAGAEVAIREHNAPGARHLTAVSR